MSCLMINDIDAGLGRFGELQVNIKNAVFIVLLRQHLF